MLPLVACKAKRVVEEAVRNDGQRVLSDSSPSQSLPLTSEIESEVTATFSFQLESSPLLGADSVRQTRLGGHHESQTEEKINGMETNSFQERGRMDETFASSIIKEY